MSDGKSLEWYATASETIQALYQQELRRDADFGGWANWLYHAREGGKNAEWIRSQIRESAEWHLIHDVPKSIALPRLVQAGHVWKLETGERFTAIECSQFNLFGRYLTEGVEAIRPVLAECQEIGFNMVRVWAAYGPGSAAFNSEIGVLVPAQHPEMYNALPAFMALCAAYGQYVELVAFTGGMIPGRYVDDDIMGHWAKIGVAMQGVTNVIVELANENAYHRQDALADMSIFPPLPGLICSYGINDRQPTTGLPITIPPWWPGGYEVIHTNEQFEWWRKGGHNGMEQSQGDAEGKMVPSHLPVLANENQRPDKDSTLHHHEDAAAACAMLIAGSCFHSQSGKKSSVLSTFDRPYAEAFVRGAKSFDLAFQDGRYVHNISDEGPNDLRVYRKVLPDGRFVIVRIRK